MGFWGDFGNWIWEGTILNLLFGAIGAAALFIGWLAIYGILRFLTENQVYQGLLSSDEDHPAKVALLCLITPPLFVLVIGTLIGLIIATISNLYLFFWNLIPFTGWGDSDAGMHFENLSHIYQLPFNLLDWCYYLFMATPAFTLIALGLVAFACFGLLIPRRRNTGSLGNSNMQYAALSISMFASVFSVILIIFFSSFLGGLYSGEMESYEIEMADQQYPADGHQWSPNYSYQSAEGYEVVEQNQYPFTIALLASTEKGTSGQFNSSNSGGHIACLSLNSLSDNLDACLLANPGSEVEEYQVRIQSTLELNVSVLSKFSDFNNLEDHEFYLHTTDLGMEFNTSEFRLSIPDSQDELGFMLELPNSSISNFTAAKYNIVYVPIESGESNESRNESLATYTEKVGNQTDCQTYALSGAIEPRFRTTAMAYVFTGIFLFGGVLNRYYVVSLGNNGETESRVLFRTFAASQAASVGFYGFLLLIFDPLDGMGITGLTWDTIFQTTFFVTKVGIIILVLLIAAVGIITLYRQRRLIGDGVVAMYEHERLMGKVEREWFGG